MLNGILFSIVWPIAAEAPGACCGIENSKTVDGVDWRRGGEYCAPSSMHTSSSGLGSLQISVS